jgi:hypothetical protein
LDNSTGKIYAMNNNPISVRNKIPNIYNNEINKNLMKRW